MTRDHDTRHPGGETSPAPPPSGIERPHDARLSRLRRVVHLLDDAVELPLLGWKIGLDPLLGLLPGGGDLAAAAASGWVVVEAARLGAPGTLLARMLGNVALDAVAGSVPLLGDLFDVAFRANRRNLELLEDHLADPETTLRRSRVVVAVVTAAALLLVAALGAGLWWLLASLGQLLPALS